MTTTTFNTLGYFEKLKAAGLTEQQAKAQVEVMAEALEQHNDSALQTLATKADLADTKHEILKWMLTISIGQIAFIIAVLALIR